MSEELFNQYLDGLCNAQQSSAVERWLMDAGPAELDAMFCSLWEQDHAPVPAHLQHEQWQQLQLMITPGRAAYKMKAPIIKFISFCMECIS